MGGYYLCGTPRAQHPFYIESIGIHIWSIEELCYYMKENVYLLDETILNEKLCAWLSEELGLKKLARVLLNAMEAGGPAMDFVMPIFQECGYLTRTELSYFREQLQQVQIESQDVRKKMKADYLVNYGMYVRAIGEYENILFTRSPGRIGTQFYAVVLENMAAAYAHLFRFEEAAECLWESYSTLKSRKVYDKYLRLLPLFLPEKRYQERLAEIMAVRDQAEAMMADTAAILREARESRFAKEWDALPAKERLAELKKEYLKMSQG